MDSKPKSQSGGPELFPGMGGYALFCNSFEGSNEKNGWQQKDEVLE